ncbi:uncharacterized protein [Spinacia oleracea]|uniref:Uncharacterized protein n=1 Tax=Spinacia oleracea TaxID=3562 RepID=A0ABM3RV70_SPIOL|nr:uncharacterized protein LOC110788544 [Spinacia oleracea]XP_056699519.1 uncharacterized protein LOC110788544 [Spinacia oleracea]XP_056699520.1 uncharacterized protein LOC110788544 [Spinacia oleracea]XP_056699521.1 uncharacterized protein LOC110788544 [Spinacia oleracea]XP_056699522.1 uncharacterized protein LOC110788544 [Spinacia oleracea]XP_056699523.1 uncharacterized protein LOC110788544 [Spinacia oleracea]XP_056699524.1 uncharacterized protein LOC110788544 [Spinacia oleracea]
MSRVFSFPQGVHEPFWIYYNRVNAVIEYRRTHGTLNGLRARDTCNVIYNGVNRETFKILQSNCNGELQNMHWRDFPIFSWFARVQYFDSHAYSHDFLHPCMNVNDFPHDSNVNIHELDDNHSPQVDFQNSLHFEFSKSCPESPKAQIDDIDRTINPFMFCNVIDDDDDYNSYYAKDEDRISEGNDVEKGEVSNFDVVPFSPPPPPLSTSDSHPIDDFPLDFEDNLGHLGCDSSIEDVIECEAPNLVVFDASENNNVVDVVNLIEGSFVEISSLCDVSEVACEPFVPTPFPHTPFRLKKLEIYPSFPISLPYFLRAPPLEDSPPSIHPQMPYLNIIEEIGSLATQNEFVEENEAYLYPFSLSPFDSSSYFLTFPFDFSYSWHLTPHRHRVAFYFVHASHLTLA